MTTPATRHHKPSQIPVGERYGMLVVSAPSTPLFKKRSDQATDRKIAMYLCACDCGNECIVSGIQMVIGKRVDCAGSQHCRSNSINDVGVRYGRLVVLSLTKRNKKNPTRLCKCDCGVVKEVVGGNLRGGVTKSCGCLARELASKRARKRRLTEEDRLLNVLINAYRSSSKRRGREWELGRDDAKALFFGNCYYCGLSSADAKVSSNNEKNRSGTPYNGIDRVNNERGYTRDNTVSCCETCNRAKLQMSVEDFSSWIRRVHQHMHKSWWDVEPIVGAA